MTLAAGVRLGPYEVVSAIGAGGMDEVYRARDTRLDREVAIKVLAGALTDPERLRRFEQEARSIASLSHLRTLGWNPMFARVRGDPRTAGLLRRMGLPT